MQMLCSTATCAREVPRDALDAVTAPLEHPNGDAGCSGLVPLWPDSPEGQAIRAAVEAAGAEHPTLGHDPRFNNPRAGGKKD